MNRTVLGLALAALGVALAVVSGLADVIGVGGADEFGWKQIAGIAVGVAAVVVGVVLAVTARDGRREATGASPEGP